MGGRPWSRGCGGARGPGAVAEGLTSESRAGVGTELRIRVEDKEGLYWARSQSHFPFGRGRNGSSQPPRASSAPGLGEGRRGRRNLSRRRLVGSEEGERRGGGQRVWAFPGLSAGRVELGAWQPCRFSFLLSPCALRYVLFLESVPSQRSDSHSHSPPFPAAGPRRSLPSGQLVGRSLPDLIVWDCRAICLPVLSERLSSTVAVEFILWNQNLFRNI